MVVRSLKRITPKIWIPPIYTANWRVTVERTDGTIDDITDIISSCNIEDGVTEGIGIFEFGIYNPNETYTNVWTGMEIFRYFCDYASGTPTTLRFRGRVEKPSNQNNMVNVTGRSETLFVHDQHISKVYEDQDAGFMIKDLFDTYGQSRFDTSGIDTSTGIPLTFTFNDIPFWDAIEAICIASGYDCYVAAALTVEFFLAGSRLNTGEAIIHDYNLMEVGDFAPDLQFIKNQVRVVGGLIDGVQVVYTANDTASQTTHGIRRENVDDDGVVTFAAAKELAEFILSTRKDPPTVGDVRGIHLATIQPGENIRISSPTENIPPNNYRTVHYKIEIDDGQGFTTVTINKEPKRISHVLKERIQREHKQTDSATNPNDLDFADIELFNADTGTMSNTEITDGVLKLSLGFTLGTWTSDAYSTADSNNVNQIRISIVGDNLPGVRIEVSADNGLNYQDVDRDSLVTIGAPGKSIKVRLTLTGTNTITQVDSLKIQYSTS